ncbi:MAG TPA: hemerythrin domain-containing protein [Polyangia bacterium]|jgi:predicted transcriptional regulator
MTQNGSPEQAALDKARHDLDDEHQQLRRIVGRMREARDTATLAAALDELHPRLKEHFAHEEFPNGLYHSMGALARDHAAEVRELVDEHFQLLSAVRGLADEARRHQGGGPEGLLRNAGAIADRLRAHEEKELKLADTLHHR